MWCLSPRSDPMSGSQALPLTPGPGIVLSATGPMTSLPTPLLRTKHRGHPPSPPCLLLLV